ncbi:hypothetical protein BAC3_00750 [uncultured bacterium]|nr:hypothetical protein BAC3_00750 [uncultured bacterium]
MNKLVYIYLIILFSNATIIKAASLCETPKLSKLITSACTSEKFKESDKLLNIQYQDTLSVVKNKQALIQRQQRWLNNIKKQCNDENCLIKHFDERYSKLSSLYYNTSEILKLNKTLNKTYQNTLSVVKHKQQLINKQQRWLNSIKKQCANNHDCLIEQIRQRIAILSELFANSVQVSEQALTDKQTETLCKAITKLSDNRSLEKYAITGIDNETANKLGWGITKTEEEFLESQFLGYFGELYKIRLNKQKNLTRFVKIFNGGSCVSSELYNIPHLLKSKEKYAISKEKVYDHDIEIDVPYFGDSEYPIFYKSRNFIITHNDNNKREIDMISLIKSDGKIKPMCLLNTKGNYKTIISAKNNKLCKLVASKTLKPLQWKSVIEKLPINPDPQKYVDDFIEKYKVFAHAVDLLTIDINKDGTSEHIGRFIYNSSGCGYIQTQLALLSTDLSGLVKNKLNELLTDNALTGEIYKYKNQYYIEADDEQHGLRLLQFKHNQVEQVCQFDKRTKTGIQRLF